MLTPCSKWMIYSASYLPMYLILLVRVLLDGIGDMSFEECMRQNLAKHIIVIVILVLLLIISVMTVLSIRKIKPTERIYKRVKDNRTIEMCSFIFPYVISIIAINLDWFGWVINCAIYIGLGVFIITSNKLRLCPAFLWARYKLYVDDNGIYILSRNSIESINLALDDDYNGIEAKRLTKDLLMSQK